MYELFCGLCWNYDWLGELHDLYPGNLRCHKREFMYRLCRGDLCVELCRDHMFKLRYGHLCIINWDNRMHELCHWNVTG